MLMIRCPECGTRGSISLVQPCYEGPYRCWKCQKIITVKIENNELKLCMPFPQEDIKDDTEK